MELAIGGTKSMDRTASKQAEGGYSRERTSMFDAEAPERNLDVALVGTVPTAAVKQTSANC